MWCWSINRQNRKYSSVVRPRKSLKALCKAKLHQRKSQGQCLVVCYGSDPLQLSESQQNHYIWEVCSVNQWDAPKNTMSAASTGQQKGPSSSPRQHLTACHTTIASKVEPIGLRSFASSAIFSSRQLTTTFSIISTTFCRQNASTTSKR